jgi:hypothetical protein
MLRILSRRPPVAVVTRNHAEPTADLHGAMQKINPKQSLVRVYRDAASGRSIVVCGQKIV